MSGRIRLLHGLQLDTWIAERIPYIRGRFGESVSIGVGDDDHLMAGVIYYGYTGHDMQVSMASVDPRWCNRYTLRALLSHPFKTCGCERLTAHTAADNKKMIKLFKGLGFVQEGRLRKGFPHADALIFGMLRDDCKWIR